MCVETSAWSHCLYEGISTQHLQIKVYFCICLDTETEVLTTSKLLKFVFVKESSKTKHYYVFALAAIETWNIYECMTWFEKVKWSWNSENSHICCHLVKTDDTVNKCEANFSGNFLILVETWYCTQTNTYWKFFFDI